MSFDRVELLIGCGAVVCVCLGIFAFNIYHNGWFPSTFEAAFTSVARCVDEENAVTCARSGVIKLLDLKSGAGVMDVLSARLSPQRCHYIGHVVGQQLFVKYHRVEDAIAQCDRSCDSACIHGIISQAFAEELGFGSADKAPDIDLKHLNVDDMRKVGKRLCASPEACHGVGHALFQMYEEFRRGLSACREVATEATMYYCYQGLFMEYADVLSERNTRPVPGVAYPTPESLASLCDLPTLEERRSCFRYFPRMVTSTFEKNGFSSAEAMRRLRGMCRSFPQKDDEIACIIGIGVYSSYSLMTDVETAVRRCERFPALVDQAACNLGQISVATQDRQSKVVAYCAAVSGASLQEHCYQGVFFFLNWLGTPTQEAVALCNGDSTCIKETKNYKLDPWELLRQDFKQ